MWRDLRLAARSLWRSPTFTLTATLALGLAIGANAAIFSLVDGLWFRPAGVRDAGALVRVLPVTAEARDGLWSFAEYELLRDRTRSLSGVGALGRRGVLLPGADGRAELVLANVVSLDFFTTLGVVPAHGRLFTPADAPALEQSPGVVLGHEFWRTQYGADPRVVGSTVRLGADGRLPVTVLGVLPASFREIEAALDRDVWMPPETWARWSSAGDFEGRANRWFEIVGRRAPGVSVEAAGAEVVAAAAAMAREFPGTNRNRSARVISELAYRIETGGTNAAALLGLVLLVVLITCVNIANLLLARAAGRQDELSLRVALGASRRRLLRQLMSESVLIGAIGTGAGLLVAMWLIRFLPSLLVEPPGFRAFTIFEVDGRVVAFTLGVALVTTLLFGLAPSWTASRSDVAALMKTKDARTTRTRRAGRFGGPLVVTQIAVSLVLLSAAGVLARSFLAAERADLGFERLPVLTAWSQVNTPAATLRSAVRRLEGLPDVRRVAVAIRAPLSLSGGGLASTVPAPDAGPAAAATDVKYGAVSANYFDVMGVAVRSGRTFTAEDEIAGGEPVVIVSERFAARFLPGPDPVGRRIAIGRDDVRHRVVGVVEDAVINEVGEAREPYFYLPYWAGDHGEVTFLVATSGDAATIAPSVRAALVDVDETLEPRRLLAMAQYVEYSTSAYRATAALAVALGIVGLFLTALGVYGVIAHRTTRRVREIGIRLALGAARGQVLALVLREGVRIGVLGLIVGVPAALAATNLLRSLLFGIEPWDAVGLAGAILVLCLAVFAATFIPAWRATRVSPCVSLRDT